MENYTKRRKYLGEVLSKIHSMTLVVNLYNNVSTKLNKNKLLNIMELLALKF